MTNHKKILIVDDEIKITEIVKSYLEKYDYAVYTAFNGERAIELFNQYKPDLIILDLMLPDISGEEICQMIKSKSKVPIIMLSAKADEESILKGFKLGADDYVTKPFSLKQLVARVTAIVRRNSSNAFLQQI